MAGMAKEMAKLDGITVQSVMKMTPAADGQPASGASGSESQAAAQQSRPKTETPSLGGVLGGKLGGFGGFVRKKKAEAPKEEKQESASTAEPSAGSSDALVEMTTEMSGFSSSPVDPSNFAVPSGYKKVESGMQRR